MARPFPSSAVHETLIAILSFLIKRKKFEDAILIRLIYSILLKHSFDLQDGANAMEIK